MSNDNSQTNQQIHELLVRGFKAHERGKFNEASQCCKEILEKNTKLAPAHFLMGLIAVASNDPNTALNAFLNTVEIDNHHVASWAHLAFIYMTNNEVDQADKALKNTLQIRTNEPLILDLIGKTLTLMGEHKQAKSFFGTAYTLSPDNIEFAHNLATNLVYLGETNNAVNLFQSIIKRQPDSPHPHWSIAFATKARDTSHIEEMNEQCINNQNPLSQAFYRYAMGKEFEDLEKWDDAFQQYSLGAKAKRSIQSYDEKTEIEFFNFLTKNFTKDWLAQSNEGFEDSSPIFVLGQPRTGTTLIERIITSHSDVYSAGELQQFPMAIQQLTKNTKLNQFSLKLIEDALQIKGKELGSLYIKSANRLVGNKPRFVDKLPLNYLYLPLILKALPNAKIVHLVRDPMDACFSSFKQLFVNTYKHSYDLKEMARHHIRYRQLMQNWREQFPERFLDISYEETARDLESNARRLIDYLELPWQDACLNFHKLDTAVTTASSVQVREPTHTRSIGRWLKYETHLQPMLEIFKKII